jgi:hypothetical protein
MLAAFQFRYCAGLKFQGGVGLSDPFRSIFDLSK